MHLLDHLERLGRQTDPRHICDRIVTGGLVVMLVTVIMTVIMPMVVTMLMFMSNFFRHPAILRILPT